MIVSEKDAALEAFAQIRKKAIAEAPTNRRTIGWPELAIPRPAKQQKDWFDSKPDSNNKNPVSPGPAPTPEDFGLKRFETACSFGERRKKRIGAFFSLPMIAIPVAVVLVWIERSRDEAIIVAVCSLIGTALLIYLLNNLIEKKSPFLQQLAKYESTTREHKRLEKIYNAYIEKCQRNFWLNLDGHDFEMELASLFRKSGRKATVTARSGDGGIDIWIESASSRIPVQCKRLAKPVGVGAVREFLGAMHDKNAARGILASVSGYTVEATRFAARHSIELMDIDDILAMQLAQ